ncbi:MAG: TerB family tellurite resistance protein [Pyrinomonadaceae bacterium]|nr:TerB family tellurite resistance protein [Pyrinomonadaceae bacterium]
MADWKKLLKAVLLADGTLDATEAELLKKEILADNVVDQEEIDFLIELHNEAQSSSKEFNDLFYQSLKQNILEDGVIDEAEAKKLRELIFADGKVDDEEKELLQALKEGSKETSSAFNDLYDECMKQ